MISSISNIYLAALLFALFKHCEKIRYDFSGLYETIFPVGVFFWVGIKNIKLVVAMAWSKLFPFYVCINMLFRLPVLLFNLDILGWWVLLLFIFSVKDPLFLLFFCSCCSNIEKKINLENLFCLLFTGYRVGEESIVRRQEFVFCVSADNGNWDQFVYMLE